MAVAQTTMQLHITIYQDAEGGDKFRVYKPDDTPDGMEDVTDQYEVAACEDAETCRTGFVVMQKED